MVVAPASLEQGVFSLEKIGIPEGETGGLGDWKQA